MRLTHPESGLFEMWGCAVFNDMVHLVDVTAAVLVCKFLVVAMLRYCLRGKLCTVKFISKCTFEVVLCLIDPYV